MAYVEMIPADRPINMLGRPIEIDMDGLGSAPVEAVGFDWTSPDNAQNTLVGGLGDLGACCMSCAGGGPCAGMGDLHVRETVSNGLAGAEDALNQATAIFERLGGPGAVEGVQAASSLGAKVQSAREMLPAAFDLYQAIALETRVQRLETTAKQLLATAQRMEARSGGMSGLGDLMGGVPGVSTNKWTKPALLALGVFVGWRLYKKGRLL